MIYDFFEFKLVPPLTPAGVNLHPPFRQEAMSTVTFKWGHLYLHSFFASSDVVFVTSSCCRTCKVIVFGINTDIFASFFDPLDIFVTLSERRSIPHLSPSSRRATSSAYPRVWSMHSTKDTPLSTRASYLRIINSRARMKYRGDVMPPCSTPLLIGNFSALMSSPPTPDVVPIGRLLCSEHCADFYRNFRLFQRLVQELV